MTEGSRRFTDQEVALVLRRASELDDGDPRSAATGGGLSLQELTDIAAEVGISREAIERAVASLDRGREIGPALAGAPLVRKAAHAVPGRLGRDAVADLVRIVDERTAAAGTVSEALGSVRWTSSERFRSTRVSITPRESETTIEVVEKAVPQLRVVMHLVPTLWGLALVGPFMGVFDLTGGGMLAAAALALAAGAAIGRGAWNMASASSGRRVRRLAEGLADAAYRGSGQGSAEGGGPAA